MRTLMRLLGGFAAGMAVLLILAAWRLSLGPVSLAFLTPVAEDLVNGWHRPVQVRLGDAVVVWEGWQRAIDLRFIDVQAIDAGGKAIARVPALSVSLSARALSHGLIAPRAVRLYSPDLRLRHEQQGFRLLFGDTSDSGELARLVIEALAAAPSSDNAMSYLERVEIVDADLTYQDAVIGASWQAPGSEVELWRENGRARGRATVNALAGDDSAHVQVIGDYWPAERRLELEASFTALRPAAFSRMAPALKALHSVDLPLGGTATISITAGAVEEASFAVRGGPGELALSTELAREEGLLPWAQRVGIRRIELRGRFNGRKRSVDVDRLMVELRGGATVHLPPPVEQDIPLAALSGRGRYLIGEQRLEFDSLSVDLGKGASVWIPFPTGHAMPLRRFAARGAYLAERGRLEISALDGDLGGAALSVAAVIDHLGGAVAITAQGTLTDIGLNDLTRYWPRALNPQTYDWVTTHLADGEVPEVRFRIAASADGNGGLEINGLSGSMRIDNARVDYLPPLPEVRGVAGIATFDQDQFTFAVTSGSAAGLTVRRGSVGLTGLAGDDQRAEVDLVIEGPLRKHLELINHPPLGYARAIGLDPKTTGGRAEVDLRVRFPLAGDLTLEQVDITAEARLRDVRIGSVVLGKDLTRGALALSLDKNGVDLVGRASLQGIAGTIDGRENFRSAAPFRRRIEITVGKADLADVERLFFDRTPIPDTVAGGSLAATVRFTAYAAGNGEIEADLDFADAYVEVPYFNWAKKAGAPAGGRVTARIDRDGTVTIPGFSVLAPGLSLAGSAAFNPDGGLQHVDFERVVAGRTDAGGAVLPVADGGWVVVVRGASLDLAPVWPQLRSTRFQEPELLGEHQGIAVRVDLETLWIAAERRLEEVSGTAVREGGVWSLVKATGKTVDGAALEVLIRPGEDGNRRLRISAQNAGSALRALDLFDNMRGGQLTIDGVFRDDRLGRQLEGRAEISDYRVVEAPLLTHVLSVLALTGIVDALKGDGLAFDTLKVPFTLDGKVLHIADARVSGLSLGFTASGTVDLAADEMDLEGTIIPAYAVNSVLGHIPLLGYVLTGGGKGGGVFAATYAMRGRLDDPNVSVNPLAVLTPGILRQVFNVFDSDGMTSELPLQPQSGGDEPGDESP